MPMQGSSAERDTEVAAAREAYARRDWVTARARFAAAAQQTGLDAADQYAWATCAWWLGDLDAALPALQEAHDGFLREGRPDLAASAALDAAYSYVLRSELAQATGWLNRTARLLEETGECPVHGTYAFALFDLALADGVLGHARRVRELGERLHDPTCLGLGAVALGRLELRAGHVERGMALLDEAMLHAVSDELPPTGPGRSTASSCRRARRSVTCGGPRSGPGAPRAGARACPAAAPSWGAAGSTVPPSSSCGAGGRTPSERSCGRWRRSWTSTSPTPPRATTCWGSCAVSRATWRPRTRPSPALTPWAATRSPARPCSTWPRGRWR